MAGGLSVYQILSKRALNEQVTMMEVEAPLIAKKARPGQFIIFRVDEFGERVPLTVAATDPGCGAVTIIFQAVGLATKKLQQLEAGDAILDFVGPLGRPSDLDGARRAVVIGGGVGNAIAYPSARYLHEQGAEVDVIAGFRSRDMVILEEELAAASTRLYITTDDGSYGEAGFVTDKLRALLEAGNEYDLAIAIGPVPMMKFVSLLTREYNLRTLVSLNPIMVDGTGMCGGCRVLVGGETRFACVDGPEFDGHQVDFDDLMLRNRSYLEQEQEDHTCRLEQATRNIEAQHAP